MGSIIGVKLLGVDVGEDFFEREEEVVLTVEAKESGAGLPLIGTTDLTSSDGIEFDVEQTILKGLKIEEDGIFEAIGPEMTAAMEARIEPLGEGAVEALHEGGDVEQFLIEAEPLGVGPEAGMDGEARSVEGLGATAELLRGEDAELFEEEDEVVVIAHDGEGDELGAVGVEEEMEEFDEFLGDLAAMEGEVEGRAGDAGVGVVEGVVWAFKARHTHG